MQSTKVEDLMVSLHEYATVYQEASLAEALAVFGRAQKKSDPSRRHHRTILVLDMDNSVVGEITHLDILRVITPQHGKFLEKGVKSSAGNGRKSLKVLEELHLWAELLRSIHAKANRLKVKDIMYVPSDVEYVDYCTTLCAVVHQAAVGVQHPLLVTRGNTITGMLRMKDIFKKLREEDFSN